MREMNTRRTYRYAMGASTIGRAHLNQRGTPKQILADYVALKRSVGDAHVALLILDAAGTEYSIDDVRLAVTLADMPADRR